MTRALLFDSPGPPGPQGKQGPVGPRGPTGLSGSNVQTFNVKDYGAKGDGATDDGTAIQDAIDAALAAQQVILDGAAVRGGGLESMVWVTLPKGKYVSSTRTIEVPDYIGVRGDPGTTIVSTNYTIPIFRIGGYYNRFENITFGGGRNAIAIYGPSTHYGGSLGDPAIGGPNHLIRCSFRSQRGPSVWQDLSYVGQNHGSSAALFFKGSDFQTACAFWGAFDCVKVSDAYTFFGNNAANGWVPAYDDSGNALEFFVSTDMLILDNFLGIPDTDPTLKPAWFGGGGIFDASNRTRFGGESIAVIARLRATSTLYGHTLPIDSGITRPEIHLSHCALASIGGVNWLEIYDHFPSIIEVADVQIISSVQSLGVWVDSASCPVSGFENEDHRKIAVDIDTGNPAPFFSKFRTSSSPSSTTATDITDVVSQFSVTGAATPPVSELPNLWLTDKVSLSNADSTAATGVSINGSPDTSTAYSLADITSTTMTDSANVNSTFNSWGGSLAAGLYTMSLYVKSTSANEAIITFGSTIVADLPFAGGNAWQRIDFTFYHDGSAKNISVGFYNIAAGSKIIAGLFQINAGPSPTGWLYPGNAQTEVVGLASYYGSGPPVSGTYVLGDTVINTSPMSGGYIGWVCTAGGSPGTWKGFGAIA